MNNSIVFIHKSNVKNSIPQQSYIQDVIKYCAHYNPNKKIIFIGDDGNKKYCTHPNVIFKNLNEYNTSSILFKEFDKNFKVVRGKKNAASPEMLKFYFQRIIYMYEILTELNINSYWTFDTDTLILDDLSKHEYKFKNYDCTEQCNGGCMNGYINNISIVKNYIKHFIYIFTNEKFINEQQKEFDTINTNFAFTEMRAYIDFKEKNKIKSIDLSTPINNETFDHTLMQKWGPNKDKNNTWDYAGNKKIIYEKSDGLYFKLKDKFHKIITVNLSWLPTNLFTEIFKKSIKKNI